ncbi:MAG TPA: CopY family transcriptional regulator [Actinobacteria bacterium]|jgi:predicted transcriptional regulator|nr:CopY family transcriptional regulator [Actinomycetota bacterium]
MGRAEVILLVRTKRKRRVKLNGLNELETEIMQIVWTRGRTTVRDVHEELLLVGYTPYTTVMAAMNNLAQKGVLKQDKKDRAYSYKPAVSSAQMANDIVDNVIDKILGGSASPIISHLLKLNGEDEVVEILELRKKLQS